MPKLGLTMTEGAVVEWSVAPGARFAAGQTLFVVESEKTAVEIEAPADGVLHEVLVPLDEVVPVGTEIGKWTLEGHVAVSDAERREQEADAPAPDAGRIVATPLARRHANAKGIALAEVTATGPRGRVVAADVEAAVKARDASTAQAGMGASLADSSTGTRETPTISHRTMASRVSASKREIPHFYLGIDVDAGALTTLRRSLNERPGQARISVTHLLMAAVAEALRREPSMNRVWLDDALVRLPTLDVGLAIDTPHGLVSPVVRDLGAKSLAAIAETVDAAIARAQDAALRPSDHGGAAIALSNAGMHDVRHMISIIVPGQSAILGVGSMQSCFRPDAQGRPELRREFSIMLSADHRVHTGVSALRFLNALKAVLQQPASLVRAGG